MKFVMKTTDGKTIDTDEGKPVTIDGIRYMMFRLVDDITPSQFKPSQFNNIEDENSSLESFFGVTKKKLNSKQRKLNKKSIAYVVRQWLETKPKNGDTINFNAPTDYAIRVAAESKNCKVIIRRVRKGLYNVTFDKKRVYARSTRA